MSRSITVTVLPVRGGGLFLGGLAVGVLALAVWLPAAAPRPAQGVDPAASPTVPEHTITVTGTGTISITPDTADVRLGIQVQKPTVEQARSSAAAAMTKVVAALQKDGIAERDITTAMLSLSPTYDYASSGAPPRITGYQFANEVTVTVRKLDRLGSTIDDAIAAGATTLDGVTFRLADPTPIERQARSSAMTDAKSSADALAAAAGVSIVGVSQVTETSSPAPTIQTYDYSKAAVAAPTTPVLAGTTTVTVSVTVVYRIG